MEHDDRREIFERLEALERLGRSRSGEHGGRDEHRRGGRERHDHGRHEHGRDDRGRGRGEGEFEEKRFIDTIVRLVGERVERVVQDQLAKVQPHDDEGREKRIVDLVVRLVSERVREIVQETVSTELDRRFGRGESPPEQR